MAYQKQNFKDGQTLTADMLNHIEDNLVALSNNKVAYQRQNFKDGQTLTADMLNYIEGNLIALSNNKVAYQRQNFKDGQTLTADMLNYIEDNLVALNNNKVVDLVMFMGQSNMAGRGVAAESIVVPDGYGYEFRAISDPTKLYPVVEPFGVNENNSSSGVTEKSKTGSMVSAFITEYYKYRKIPIVGVSCSKGGTTTSFWAPNGAPLNDAIARHAAAKKWLEDNGYTIARDFMVWCQGESDGDNGVTSDTYTSNLIAIIEEMIAKAKIEFCAIVRIGNNRDYPLLYDNIISAQTNLCKNNDNVVLVSAKLAGFAEEGKMKDIIHYTQAGYNEVGTDAGRNTAYYINNGIEPYMYDPEYKTLYFPYNEGFSRFYCQTT